ncbi:hypothetical protein EZS27_035926, partial [termite gut metagenome]
RFELVDTMPIHLAMEFVKENTLKYRDALLVRIEDARQRTWFQSSMKSREEERKMLQGVGSVKRDCAIWEAFLTDIHANFELVHPKNSKTKLKAEAFKKLTKWEKRTNEHARDAAMLVFGY